MYISDSFFPLDRSKTLHHENDPILSVPSLWSPFLCHLRQNTRNWTRTKMKKKKDIFFYCSSLFSWFLSQQKQSFHLLQRVWVDVRLSLHFGTFIKEKKRRCNSILFDTHSCHTASSATKKFLRGITISKTMLVFMHTF